MADMLLLTSGQYRVRSVTPLSNLTSTASLSRWNLYSNQLITIQGKNDNLFKVHIRINVSRTGLDILILA